MIVESNKQNLDKIIEHCKKRELIYLNITKDDKDIVIDYDLKSEIKDEDKVNIIDEKIRKSLSKTNSLIKRLQQLQALIENNACIIAYNLLYDAKQPEVVFSFSNTLTPGSEIILNNNTKPIVQINWDNAFTDRLNDIVPEIFVRKSSKKYSQITYRELREILKNDNQK